jgi:hypothetical protein
LACWFTDTFPVDAVAVMPPLPPLPPLEDWLDAEVAERPPPDDTPVLIDVVFVPPSPPRTVPVETEVELLFSAVATVVLSLAEEPPPAVELLVVLPAVAD